MKKRITVIAVLMIGVGMVGCAQKDEEAAPAEAAAETVATTPPDAAATDNDGTDAGEPVETQTFEGTGVVKNITPSKSHIIIEHEVIPGFMDAMTMPFQIKDQKVLDGITRGDKIHFVLTVTGNDVYVSAIEKVGE